MARKKSKQQVGGQKDLAGGQQPQQQQSLPQNPVCPGDAAGGGGGGGDAGVDRLARDNQSMHTCCLLCHREFKDWGAGLANGLVAPKLGDAAPGRKQPEPVPTLLGEVPLWICQSCKKSVEEDERRAAAQEQATPVPLSHSTSCKSQSCGNGFPEQSLVDWDPSSFLSAHKLSGLWNSAHTNGGAHCAHGTASHSQQGGTIGATCHEKRSSHDAPGKAAKASGTKVCPYSHPASQNSGTASLSTSADLCKTTPKHFKTMCRRPTPPGEAFHPTDHHTHSDLSVPPNSPTGLSSQHSSLLPPKQASSQHTHVGPPSPALPAHAPFSPLVPNHHTPASNKHPASTGADSPTALHMSGACKNSHIPPISAQHSKLGNPLMGCTHPCNGHNSGTVTSSTTGHLTAGACRDQACKGHKVANGTLCHPPCELEEGEDEDSSSERSSCASSSTNQKDGKYCDCCYCEFFGHNAPPAAPTSRNYAEIREKLRSRLTRRKEELPQRQDADPAVPSAIDHRDVDELLDFINSTEPKPVNSAKAAKRARHKQKKKERAQQSTMESHLSDPHGSPPEQLEESTTESEGNRLLEWPQLELERVNSFLTSRLEEIKNTIKDSIRASFSMYDLNLDVSDFPKKAATMESNHLLSHLNGSSDLQPIDLDMAPLSLRDFKRDLELVRNWEDTTATTKDIQRLNSTPSLSKLIRIRSPDRSPAPASEDAQATHTKTAKPKEEAPDAKNSIGTGVKTKKAKKLLQQQRLQQEQAQQDQSQAKASKAAAAIWNELRKAPENRPVESDKSSKSGSKQNSHFPPPAESNRNGQKKAEEAKVPKQQHNGAVCSVQSAGSGPQRGKSDSDARANRLEQDSEGRAFSGAPVNSQQAKGRHKKSKNKTDKSSSAIDDVFLPKDLDPTEMDEIDREVEYFKRFCLDSAKQTRQKVAVNWSNFSLKKMPSNVAQ
ncbi:protein FAM193B isoform X2 [Denticeps clupeoides]|uniref:protein FAM193B isoform X2 n=1 Tax=Denticeps clupeoides TaxID=299321 RepID=UPI0010A344B1|nr:protein FAM193B isoform X2 [Denticeps clupeoides]